MRNIRTTVVFAVCALIMSGCTFDERLTTPMKEGVPTKVQLGYCVEGGMPLTRAEQEPTYENRVDNLYIFVFDAEGNRVATTDDAGNPKSFFVDGSSLSVTQGDGTEGNLTNGTLVFNVGSVLDATIIGVANLTTENTATAFHVTKEDLDGITTLNSLSSFVMRMENGNTIERNALFMMTGYAVDNATGSTSIDIIGEEGGISELQCSVRLTRVDAKIRVDVTSKAADPSWSKFSFEPKTWRVMRVPSQTLLLPYDQTSKKTVAGPWLDPDGVAWDADEEGAEYFDTEERVFEQMDDMEDDNTQYYTGGSFVFYMPENRKRYKEKIELTGTDGYALREESNTTSVVDGNKPGQQYTNTDFRYADPNSTYLVLTGYLSYIMEDGTVVNTDARYLVHLGYFSKDPNDYDTKRNGDYTYNITVTGVNSLLMEVANGADDREDRPGYEGDVVYSSNEIYYLDSHYDRCLLKIRPSDVTDGMTWSVKTPFSTGVHAVGDDTYEDVEDFRWIKFAINKKYNVAHDRYVKFPGELDGQYNPEWEPASASLDDVPQLLDIDQLVQYLKLVKKSDTDLSSLKTSEDLDHVCITAFVDEYLYFKHPVTEEENLQLWHDCVDREDRMMHIVVPDAEITGGEYYSPDGNTSLVTSIYSFIQKSIRTVYNANNPGLQTAWGLESVMETGRLPVGDVSSAIGNPDYNSNGRRNSTMWMVGENWTSVIETSERYGLKSPYENAAYACLLRNRDLNGDNIVQENEVRWYLAAINQLTDIFIGEWALDETSRLYPYNPAQGNYPKNESGENTVYWHYTSSSPDPDRGNYPNVLWAEEGASRGNYNNGSTNLNGFNYSYRCVRNLGIDVNDLETEPIDLVRVISGEEVGEEAGTWVIDLSRMNPKSLRSSMDGGQPLPLDDEKGANNRPYTKFVVGANIYPEDNIRHVDGGEAGAFNRTTKDEIVLEWQNNNPWYVYQNYNPCPTGYRVPTQRELLIMTTRLSRDEEHWPSYEVTVKWSTWAVWQGGVKWDSEVRTMTPDYYLCQTSFSLKDISPYKTSDVNKQREGFGWHYSSNVFMLQNDRNTDVGYVRCIKDIN